MQEKTMDIHIKRMADLLRQGATLTELACPACASPLFRLKNGVLWCVRCEKKVVVVKEGDEVQETADTAMSKLEATLLTKIQDLQSKIQQTDNVDELQKLSTALSELLDSLDKIRKMKKT
ncbi:MAG: Sjogren's syndrome/scleroderma autoantigen 1 family protein [Candidatus Bathyarchaeia archaeon]